MVLLAQASAFFFCSILLSCKFCEFEKITMPILLAQFNLKNADYIIIAGLPEEINKHIKDFIEASFIGPKWTLHVDTLNWYPLLPHLPSLNWMDRLINAEFVPNQFFSSLIITDRCEFFEYRAGWLNRRYGHFYLLN